MKIPGTRPALTIRKFITSLVCLSLVLLPGWHSVGFADGSPEWVVARNKIAKALEPFEAEMKKYPAHSPEWEAAHNKYNAYRRQIDPDYNQAWIEAEKGKGTPVTIPANPPKQVPLQPVQQPVVAIPAVQPQQVQPIAATPAIQTRLTSSGTHRVLILSDPPGARIEVNHNYVGDTPLNVDFLSYSSNNSGTPGDYFEEDTTITALPKGAGNVQTKTFLHGSSATRVPDRIFFNMNLKPAPQEVNVKIDESGGGPAAPGR